MELNVNFSEAIGAIKPMHAVNNAPVRPMKTQCRGNFDTFKALKIPYARTHDASLSEIYGSQHVMDVHCIFTDFSRDPDDPTAYDFINTDKYVTTCFDADCEIYYRLGTSIEHWPGKYGSIKPKDPLKWAKICEHIIMHYTEGWANGYNYPIKDWEIWNEADLDDNVVNDTDKRCWSGTPEEFFEFFKIAFLYLRKRFPEIKLGGPALANNLPWARSFLEKMTEGERAELDFFSWHIYTTDAEKTLDRAHKVAALLDEFGYGHIEKHLNEWNYIENWTTKFIDSVRVLKGLKGAAYDFAFMAAGQNSPALDMMMYYDARPDKEYNGLWNSDFMLPLKGYYAFDFFSSLYQLGTQTKLECDDKELYAIAATDGEKNALVVSYYTCDENATEKIFKVQLDRADDYAVYAIDEAHSGEKIAAFSGTAIEISMKPNTLVKIANGGN